MAEDLFSSIEHRETLDYFVDFPRRVLGGIVGTGVIGRIGVFTLRKFSGLIGNRFNSFDKELWREYADLLGISPSDAVRSLAYPDTMLYMVGKGTSMMKSIPQVYLGCTSFTAKEKGSRKGTLLHGRNLDFFGGKSWTRDHAIIVSRPKERYASITITADGLYLPGLTSINEAGIAVSLHVLFSREVSLKGEPVLSLVSEVLGKASSIEEAAEVLKSRKTSCGWGIMLSDAKTSETALFEMNGKGSIFKDVTADSFGYVNMCRTNMREDEFVPTYAWVQNNYYRKTRLEELLKKCRRKLDAPNSFTIIGDDYDAGQKRRSVAGSTISNAFTISSAVFDYGSDSLCVGNGTTPAPHGEIYEYSLTDLFSGGTEPVKIHKPKFEQSDASKKYVELGYEYTETRDCSRIAERMRDLADNYGGEFAFPLFTSVCLATMEEYDKALDYIDKALEFKVDNYREGTMKLLKGMYLDRKGDRFAALKIYEDILANHRYPCTTSRTVHYLKTKCPQKDIDKIELNWFISFVVML